MRSKVKVYDAEGRELYVRPVDAAEIVAQGGSYDLKEMKKETERENKVIIEGVTTGRADSIPHVPVSPDSARESIDYDAQNEDQEGSAKESAYPKGFPGASVLEGQKVGYHQANRMTRDELLAVDGIGEKTADAILASRKEK